MTRALATAVLAVLCLPGVAGAHGVVHEIEDRGDRFAVRARYAGGRPLAGASYRIVSPAAPDRPWGSGETDAQGWVELVPDAPGTWVVRIVDATGHGRTVKLEVSAARAAARREPAPPAAAPARAGERTPAAPPAPAPAPRTPGRLGAIVAAAALLAGFLAVRALHRTRAARR